MVKLPNRIADVIFEYRDGTKSIHSGVHPLISIRNSKGERPYYATLQATISEKEFMMLDDKTKECITSIFFKDTVHCMFSGRIAGRMTIKPHWLHKYMTYPIL